MIFLINVFFEKNLLYDFTYKEFLWNRKVSVPLSDCCSSHACYNIRIYVLTVYNLYSAHS